MRTRRRQRIQGIRAVLALGIALGLGSTYMVACPVLCVSRDCMQHKGPAAASASSPCHACCPGDHSRTDKRQGMPCGSPGACLVQARNAPFLIPVARLSPQFQAMPVPALGGDVLVLGAAAHTTSSAWFFPPGCCSGRSICQRDSILRI